MVSPGFFFRDLEPTAAASGAPFRGRPSSPPHRNAAANHSDGAVTAPSSHDHTTHPLSGSQQTTSVLTLGAAAGKPTGDRLGDFMHDLQRHRPYRRFLAATLLVVSVLCVLRVIVDFIRTSQSVVKLPPGLTVRLTAYFSDLPWAMSFTTCIPGAIVCGYLSFNLLVRRSWSAANGRWVFFIAVIICIGFGMSAVSPFDNYVVFTAVILFGSHCPISTTGFVAALVLGATAVVAVAIWEIALSPQRREQMLASRPIVPSAIVACVPLVLMAMLAASNTLMKRSVALRRWRRARFLRFFHAASAVTADALTVAWAREYVALRRWMRDEDAELATFKERADADGFLAEHCQRGTALPALEVPASVNDAFLPWSKAMLRLAMTVQRLRPFVPWSLIHLGLPAEGESAGGGRYRPSRRSMKSSDVSSVGTGTTTTTTTTTATATWRPTFDDSPTSPGGRGGGVVDGFVASTPKGPWRRHPRRDPTHKPPKPSSPSLLAPSGVGRGGGTTGTSIVTVHATIVRIAVLDIDFNDVELSHRLMEALCSVVITEAARYDGSVDLLSPFEVVVSFNTAVRCANRHGRMAIAYAIAVFTRLEPALKALLFVQNEDAHHAASDPKGELRPARRRASHSLLSAAGESSSSTSGSPTDAIMSTSATATASALRSAAAFRSPLHIAIDSSIVMHGTVGDQRVLQRVAVAGSAVGTTSALLSLASSTAVSIIATQRTLQLQHPSSSSSACASSNDVDGSLDQAASSNARYTALALDCVDLQSMHDNVVPTGSSSSWRGDSATAAGEAALSLLPPIVASSRVMIYDIRPFLMPASLTARCEAMKQAVRHMSQGDYDAAIAVLRADAISAAGVAVVGKSVGANSKAAPAAIRMGNSSPPSSFASPRGSGDYRLSAVLTARGRRLLTIARHLRGVHAALYNKATMPRYARQFLRWATQAGLVLGLPVRPPPIPTANGTMMGRAASVMEGTNHVTEGGGPSPTEGLLSLYTVPSPHPNALPGDPATSTDDAMLMGSDSQRDLLHHSLLRRRSRDGQHRNIRRVLTTLLHQVESQSRHPRLHKHNDNDDDVGGSAAATAVIIAEVKETDEEESLFPMILAKDGAEDDDALMIEAANDGGLGNDSGAPDDARRGGVESAAAAAVSVKRTAPVSCEPPRSVTDERGDAYLRSKRILGEGAFGRVYLGVAKESGAPVAIKVIRLVDAPAARDMLREVSVFASLNHINITSYVSVAATMEGYLFIVMEYVSGGSLARLLTDFGPLSERILRRYVGDVVKGLLYLHEHDVVHGDIKPHNLQLGCDNSCKLLDFGSAVFLRRADGTATHDSAPSTVVDVFGKSTRDGGGAFRGTPVYAAPEMALGVITPAVDVWSLGVSVFELLTGRLPWALPIGNELMFIRDVVRGLRLPEMLPERFSPQGRDFVRRCMDRDALRRAAVHELVCHPWLAQVEK